MKTVPELLRFKDSIDGAFHLSEKLSAYNDRKDVIVVAVLAGGIPIGYHLAKMLKVQLDIIPCKKLSHPTEKGKTIGSATLDEVRIHNKMIIPSDYIHYQVQHIRNELRDRYKLYMQDTKPISLKGKTVILADDIVKTGYTVLACIGSIRKQKPAKIIVAVPVSTRAASDRIESEVDEFICVIKVRDFNSAEDFYDNLTHMTDGEAKNLLNLK